MFFPPQTNPFRKLSHHAEILSLIYPPSQHNIFSESSALILQGFQTPVSKNHPLFLQKRLTNHQKFAAKPIDFSLFQSTGGDFYVTC